MASCRFCGVQNKEKEVIHLFNDKVLVENFHTIAEIVNLVFKDIQIHEYDELPKEICSNCTNNVLLSFRFYNVVNYTKSKLMEMLIQKKTIKPKYRLLLPKAIESVNKMEMGCASKLVVNKKESECTSQSNGKRMYSCYECPKKYRALRQLKKHQDEVHTTENLCNLCNVWFEQSDCNRLEKHLRTHKLSKFMCFKCGIESFSSQRRLFTHYRQKHSAEHGLFKCESCQKEIIGRQALAQHIDKNHWKNIENVDSFDKLSVKNLEIQDKERGQGSMSECKIDCNIVDKNEPDIDSNKLEEAMDVEFLDEFFLSQHTDSSFEFSECWDALDLSFEDDIKIKMSDLPYEVLPQFPAQEITGKVYQYQCPHCKKGFIRQIEILLHLAHDHKLPVLSCTICLENFSNIDELKIHKIQHLGKNLINRMEEKQMEILKTINGIIYMCKYCRRKYKEKSNFALHDCKTACHDADYDKIAKFLCNFCKKEFFNLKDMYLHKKLVHQNGNLICSLCRKRFTTIIGFQYHIKTHKGKKTIKCPFCIRKFLTKINLNAHIKAIHSIVKNHLCTLCDRNFATLDHLKKHVMSVHQKERPHLCSTCGKLFSQVSHLKSHFKIHT